MVIKKIFLPTEDSFTCLENLYSYKKVLLFKSLIDGATEMISLVNDEGRSVDLLMNSNDVVFKFEVFNLEARAASSIQWPSATEVIELNEWQEIKCLLRFEWQRPALPGEVPAHYVQIFRQRGRRSEVSDKATAIGVSMVGIVFWNAVNNLPEALIVSDDDVPQTLHFCRAHDEMEAIMAECESINLVDVKQWVRELCGSAGWVE